MGSDLDEARMEAESEARMDSYNDGYDEGVEVGRKEMREMRDDIMRIIDLKINELSRASGSQMDLAIANIQIEILQEVYGKIEKL